MKNLDQLPALDASIEKWCDVVYKGILRQECALCELNESYIECSDPRHKCVIKQITGKANCKNTSYYATSLGPKHNQPTPRVAADNRMLSELYEIRREYIASAWRDDARI